MNFSHKLLLSGAALAASIATGSASLSITLDFSAFGTSGSWASLHNDAWDGSTSDAVKQAAAENVITAAANYWEEAFASSTTNLSHTIAVNWEPKTGNTLATGGTSWNGANELSNGQLNWDNDGTSTFFVDLTPSENSEYGKFSGRDADLGGGTVNVERVYYNAPSGAAARDNSDMLTVAIHEIGHALGFLGGYDPFSDLDTGNDGDLDLTDGSEIAYSGSHHTYTLSAPETNFPYDGVTIGSNPYYPTTMGPQIFNGTRKLLTAVDIQTLGDVHGFDNLNLNPLIPEPGSAALILLGTIGLACRRRR